MRAQAWPPSRETQVGREIGSGGFLPPSPPPEQTAASQNQTGKPSPSDGAGYENCRSGREVTPGQRIKKLEVELLGRIKLTEQVRILQSESVRSIWGKCICWDCGRHDVEV